mmetsp:Transcript_14436/g.21276  ORF Transcript_14436/g.21276 Transcript_14436/m.21276 type:complete len:325 (-) Transcript_14436:85-1059(-)
MCEADVARLCSDGHSQMNEIDAMIQEMFRSDPSFRSHDSLLRTLLEPPTTEVATFPTIENDDVFNIALPVLLDEMVTFALQISQFPPEKLGSDFIVVSFADAERRRLSSLSEGEMKTGIGEQALDSMLTLFLDRVSTDAGTSAKLSSQIAEYGRKLLQSDQNKEDGESRRRLSTEAPRQSLAAQMAQYKNDIQPMIRLGFGFRKDKCLWSHFYEGKTAEISNSCASGLQEARSSYVDRLIGSGSDEPRSMSFYEKTKENDDGFFWCYVFTLPVVSCFIAAVICLDGEDDEETDEDRDGDEYFLLGDEDEEVVVHPEAYYAIPVV